MLRLIRYSLIALLCCSGLPAAAAERYADLDQWLARDLVPFVRESLATHPRFRGESLRFVVLYNGNPQATSNALTLGIRDRLQEAGADLPGVRIAWQPDDPRTVQNAAAGGLDCALNEVHYLIGVETSLSEAGLLAVEVRALDLEDRTLVPNFHRSWQGRITNSQYREFRRSETDRTFRGEREVPYDESQSDLLAARLAHDLGCNLLRQTEAEYVIGEAGAGDNAVADPVAGMVELVGNNLAQFSSLRFTASPVQANAVIEGKAHRIDDDLYQYWVTVQPTDSGAGLKALSASAYVRLPERFTPAATYAEPAPVLRSDAAILDAMRIVELQNPGACPAAPARNSSSAYGGRYAGDCYALQVRTTGDAVVFFLNHQLNHGLVRLSDLGCNDRPQARIARAGEDLRYALPRDSLPAPAWSNGEAWQLAPEMETYYALAATDTEAARALSRHIAALPKRCSGSVRPGLEGHALEAWLAELQTITKRWGPAVDWQTLRVKSVY